MGSISISTVHELSSKDEKILAEPNSKPGPLGEKRECDLCASLHLTSSEHCKMVLVPPGTAGNFIMLQWRCFEQPKTSN